MLHILHINESIDILDLTLNFNSYIHAIYIEGYEDY